MVDFRKIISPKTNAKIKRINERVAAFAALPRAEMGNALIELSRSLIDSKLFSDDQRYSYDEWALYRVIPEVARRLNPEIALRGTEVPKPDEAKDAVTWLVGASDERLAESVRSIMSNGSFRRCTTAESASQDVRDAAYMLEAWGGSPDGRVLGIAMNTLLPGFAPAKKEPDALPPLDGFFLIAILPRDTNANEASSDDYHRVLNYHDDLESARKDLEQTLAQLTSDDPEGMDQRRSIRRLGTDTKAILEFHIQTADGSVVAVEPSPVRMKGEIEAPCF